MSFLINPYSFAAGTIPPDILTGLMAWYDCEEGSGSVTADSSVNGYDIALEGSPLWYSGMIHNGCLNFDETGTQDGIVSGIPEPTTALTISAWVCAMASTGYLHTIAGTWNDFGPYRSYFIWVQFGQAALYCSRDGYEFPSIVSNTVQNTYQWYHIAGTYDGTDMRIYINGVEDATPVNNPGSIFENGQPFLIGSGPVGGVGYTGFPGRIDDVRVYPNRVLSAIDIAALADLPVLQKDSAGYWKLDDDGGGIYLDYSLNGNYASDDTSAPTPVSGHINGALSFSGSSNLFVNDSPTLTSKVNGDSISISVWAKRTGSGGGGFKAICTKIGASSAIRNYELCFAGSGLNATSNSIAFFYRNSANTAWVGYSSDNTYTDTNYHHYCFTYTFGTPSSAKMYVDGSLVTGSWKDGNGSDQPISASGGYLRIGTVDGSETMNGDLDDLRIYNRVLTSTEVAELAAM